MTEETARSAMTAQQKGFRVACPTLEEQTAGGHGAVTIQRVEKSNVGKGKIGLHFFEAHGSSKRLDFKELWQKLMNVKIYVNKFIMISLDSCFFQ